MLTQERQMRILKKLEENPFVSVKELMEELQVSRSSVMRDLDALKKEGRLVRSHGGASRYSVQETLNKAIERSVREKETIRAEEKQALCRRAAEDLRDDTCIYLDSGTTVACMIPYLRNRNLILVTSSVHLIRRLPERFRPEVHLIGGTYDQKYDMLVGIECLEQLDRFRFDTALISASGINPDTGEVTAADIAIAELKKLVMKHAGQSFLLADTSKLNQRALISFAKLSDFDAVYLNGKPQENYPDTFRTAE